MIECPDQPCEWCAELDHLVICECRCCHGETNCGCGRPGPHGCEMWIDDRKRPEWVQVVSDEFGTERAATCGPCRVAVA